MKKILILLFSILLVVFAAGCGSDEGEASSDEEEMNAAVDFNTVDAFGVVKAVEEKSVILETDAIVQTVHVKEGDLVRKGDPVFTLDLAEHNRELEKLNNELERIQLENRMAAENIKEEGRNLLEAYRQKKAEEKRLSDEVERYRTLYKQGAVSREELESREERLDDLISANKQHAQELEILYGITNPDEAAGSFTGGSRGISLQSGSRQAEQVALEIAGLNEQLAVSGIEAGQAICPMEQAVIHGIGYSVGDRLNPGKSAFSLTDNRDLVVEAEVLEEFISGIRDGLKVEIVPVADRTRSYSGEIINISQMAFPQNGDTVIPVEIEVKNPDGFLRPNFNVDVMIHLED